MRRQYAAVTTPIVSLSFTDDEFMSARNTESLHGFYTGAQRTMNASRRTMSARKGSDTSASSGIASPKVCGRGTCCRN